MKDMFDTAKGKRHIRRKELQGEKGGLMAGLSWKRMEVWGW